MVRRALVALLACAGLTAGYGALDAADLVPGLLTTAPLPTLTPAPSRPSASAGAATPTRAGTGMPVTPAGALAPMPDPAAARAALAPVLADPAATGASTVVRDALTGTTLMDVRGADPRVPASTTKLLSALAVQRALPDGTVLATMVRAGTSPDRVVLVAGGDTLLSDGAGSSEAVVGHAGLAELADQVAGVLRGHGIGSVTVQVDAGFAPGPVEAPTWPARFRGNGITGPVATLGLATQRAQPGRPGPADPVGEVAKAFVARLSERGVAAVPDPTPSASSAPAAPAAPAAPGVPGASRAAGTVGTAGQPEPSASAAPSADPSSAGPAGPSSAGGPLVPGTELGRVSSAPVTEVLALALEESDNALTESLARVAAGRAGRHTDFAGVGAFIRDSAAAAGIDVTGVTLVDASGLSTENAVPARVLADALTRAATGAEPGLAVALRGLPVAGLTGTLGERFRDATSRPGAGWVRAKTGTLQGVNTLAGLVLTADGRLLVFAVMQQGEAGTLPARAALDRFAATLASCGCR